MSVAAACSAGQPTCYFCACGMTDCSVDESAVHVEGQWAFNGLRVPYPNWAKI